MKESYKEVVSRVILNPAPVEITNSAAKTLNRLPVDDVVPILWGLFQSAEDDVVRARAFDALLKLDQFDRVQFLVDFVQVAPDGGWRIEACKRLAALPVRDIRATAKLCDVLLEDPEPDVRFAAAEALAVAGDETAVDALRHAVEHDKGKDYEGVPVSRIAERALRVIESRLRI